MSKDLVQFDALKAEVTKFVAPTLSVKVTSFETSAAAISALKTIRDYQRQVDKRAKELIAPLKAQIDLIKSLAGEVESPLARADAHLKLEVDRYAVEQMRIQDELRKAEEARIRKEEAEAEAQRLREEAQAEAKKKLELEALERTRIAEASKTARRSAFGRGLSDQDEKEAARKAIEEKHETERLEREARLDREKKMRELKAGQNEYDIRKANISHARKTYIPEVVNIDLVPVELLKRELRVREAQNAYKAGNLKPIPGLRFTEKVGVALGESTHVPRQALEGERPRRRGNE